MASDRGCRAPTVEGGQWQSYGPPTRVAIRRRGAAPDGRGARGTNHPGGGRLLGALPIDQAVAGELARQLGKAVAQFVALGVEVRVVGELPVAEVAGVQPEGLEPLLLTSIAELQELPGVDPPLTRLQM